MKQKRIFFFQKTKNVASNKLCQSMWLSTASGRANIINESTEKRFLSLDERAIKIFKNFAFFIVL